MRDDEHVIKIATGRTLQCRSLAASAMSCCRPVPLAWLTGVDKGVAGMGREGGIIRHRILPRNGPCVGLYASRKARTRDIHWGSFEHKANSEVDLGTTENALIVDVVRCVGESKCIRCFLPPFCGKR